MKNQFNLILIGILLLSFAGCSSDDTIEQSRIDTSTPELNEVDLWIRANLTQPYNIDVDYLFDDHEVATNRYLAPPYTQVVVPFLHAYMEFMIEPFETFGGSDFVKQYFSKKLVLVGSRNYNNNGTVNLGTAEGGIKVTLYELNLFEERTDVNNNSRAQVRAGYARYLETIQHEFSHILQQTAPFDKETYREITPQYRSTWYNLSEQEALNLGFITPYSSMNENEDFVEIVSLILTRSPEEFEAILNRPNNEAARQALRDKLEIIVDYYKVAWEIDLYELQIYISEKFDAYIDNQYQEEEAL